MLVPTVHEFWRVYSRHLNRLFGAIATAPEHLAFLHQTFSSGESCADGAVKKEAAQRILGGGGWWVAASAAKSEFPLNNFLKPRRAEAVAVVHLELLQVDSRFWDFVDVY